MAEHTTVMVTGASGFIASQLIRELLSQGHRVRGSVRSTLKELDWLRALRGAERLALFDAQLGSEGAFDAAADGAVCVMHTASPYALTVKDPQKDLVEPAVEGTLNVMRAAKKAKSVKRVVLTSSMAAITDEPDRKTKLTEEHWNTKSSLKRNPYYYSKTMAERAAWEFMEKERPHFSLVVLNPFMVIGPSLGPALNTSNKVFADLLMGRYPAIMDLAWGFVDVRDVALAHVLAMMTPRAKGRYVCANATMHMREVVALLRDNGFGEGFALPRRNLANPAGTVIAKAMSFFQPSGVGSYLRTHLGRWPSFDNAKIKRELGLTFRPLDKTILDTARDLEKWGHITRRSAEAGVGPPPNGPGT